MQGLIISSNENLDNLGRILDMKIKQINNIRYELTNEIRQMNRYVNIKNNLMNSIQEVGMVQMKETYKHVTEIPNILENMHLFNLYVIEQIQGKYHEQYLKMKLKYENEIKQLNLEIQNQQKIRKNMIKEVQQLKKCVQQFVKDKQIEDNKLNSKPISHLQIISEEDEVSNKHQTQQNTTSNIQQQQVLQNHIPKSYLFNNKPIQQQSHQISIIQKKQISKQAKISFQQLKKQIKKIQKTNQSQENSKSFSKLSQIAQDQSNHFDYLELSQNNSYAYTPKTIDLKNIFSEKVNNNINNSFVSKLKLPKSIQKSSYKIQDDQKPQFNSYLQTHLKKKLFQQNKMNQSVLIDRSKSKQKIAQKTQKKFSKQIIKMNKQYIKRPSVTQYMKSYLKQNLSYNRNQLISNTFFVGQKKLEIKYQGLKKDGKRNGRGTLYYSNGLTYQGIFKDNLRCGYGILKFNNIEIYNGQWQNDMFNGTGRVKNCAIIHPKKKESDSILSKWVSYSGEFKQNRFHGNGTLYLQNGQKFSCKFKNGLSDGQGTFQKKNGQIELICKNDNFVQRF